MGFKSRITSTKKTKGRRHFRAISVYQQKKGNQYAKRDEDSTVHISEEALTMLSDRQIAYKLKNPICNIRVSGKRRHKMLKRLRRVAKEQKEVKEEEVIQSEEPSEQKKKRRRHKRSKNVMGEDGQTNADTTSQTDATSMDIE